MERGYIKLNDKRIEFPEGLQILDREVLRAMAGLNPSDFSEGLTEGLTEVYIPDTVIVIARKAFADCEHLNRVFLSEENELRYIEENAFGGCRNLKHFDFELCHELKLIDSFAFTVTPITREHLNAIPTMNDMDGLHLGRTNVVDDAALV